MITKLFSVRDVKGDSFGPLTPFETTPLAQRGLVETMAAMQENHPMKNYPEDFQLYELGSYDVRSGALSSLPVPVFVMSCTEAMAILAGRQAAARGRLDMTSNKPEIPGGVMS